MPLAGLISMLLYGWSPLQASFYSIVLIVLVTLIRPATRDFARPAALLRHWIATLPQPMPVAAATAVAGIIVGVLSLTGLGAHFATVMSSIAGDTLAIWLHKRGAAAVIPSKADRTGRIPFDAEIYKWRHLAESFFCSLKAFLGIATRYETTRSLPCCRR